MVATRGRTFKRPWRRSCHSSKLKSSSAPIGQKDSWCFHAVGSSNAPLLGSTAAEGSQRIGRTSIATHWRSCGLPQSASCSENFVIPPDVFGQTLSPGTGTSTIIESDFRCRPRRGQSRSPLSQSVLGDFCNTIGSKEMVHATRINRTTRGRQPIPPTRQKRTVHQPADGCRALTIGRPPLESQDCCEEGRRRPGRPALPLKF